MFLVAVSMIKNARHALVAPYPREKHTVTFVIFPIKTLLPETHGFSSCSDRHSYSIDSPI